MATALVGEDNFDNRKLITFLFRKSGHQTREAFTGQEGIDQIRAILGEAR